MPDETPSRNTTAREPNTADGWTMSTLYLHLTSQLRDVEKRSEHARNEMDRRYAQLYEQTDKSLSAALAAAKEAVSKAELATEKRFESVNEFRGTLSDQTARLMPRTEVDGKIASITEKLADIGARLDRDEGKSAGVSSNMATVIAIIAVIGTLFSIGFGIVTTSRYSSVPVTVTAPR